MAESRVIKRRTLRASPVYTRCIQIFMNVLVNDVQTCTDEYMYIRAGEGVGDESNALHTISSPSPVLIKQVKT